MSDINTAVVDSLKVLDPDRPIREADKQGQLALAVRNNLTSWQCKSEY